MRVSLLPLHLWGRTFTYMVIKLSRFDSACTSGWNSCYLYTSGCEALYFEGNESHVKSPVIRPSAFRFVSRLRVQTFKGFCQILESQCRTQVFSLCYQFFTNNVIDMSLKPTFSARERSHQATSRTSAFTLNVASNSTVSVPDGLQLTAIPSLVSAGSGDVTPSRIMYYTTFTTTAEQAF